MSIIAKQLSRIARTHGRLLPLRLSVLSRLTFVPLYFLTILGTPSCAARQLLFKELHSFSGPDGADPYAGLIEVSDGYLYGTTRYGGANGDGVVFRITTSGDLALLHSFSGSDGSSPNSLIQATVGSLYGTTYEGGANGAGTVFEMKAGLPTPKKR